MVKKVLLGIGALLLLTVLITIYRVRTAPPKSPPDTVSYSQGGLDIKVSYSRPYKRGRTIFGEKSAGALVPFGQYWRLGANAATEITLSKAVQVAGKPLAAGNYRVYAIPSATMWKIIFNSQVGKFGFFEPDHEKDVLSIEVAPETVATPVEQFTIAVSGEPSAAKLEFTWDTTSVRLPIVAQN
jgi:hypothetical protein